MHSLVAVAITALWLTSTGCDSPDDGVDAAGQGAQASGSKGDSAVADTQGQGDDSADSANRAGSADSDAAEALAPDAVSTLPDAGRPRQWRSALYPADGSLPTAKGGATLVDYSYAGYRRSEVPIPTPATPIFDVGAHGADPLGKKDSTAAIQAAINAVAASGKPGVVWLGAGLYRIDGTLLVTHDGTVLRGAGPTMTKLWFTRHKNMSWKAHLSFIGKPGWQDCWDAYKAPGAPTAEWMTNGVYESGAASSVGLSVGDDVVVGVQVNAAFIADHAMSGTWQAFNGTWQPMEWLDLTGVSAQPGGAAKLSTKPPTRGRYKLSWQPRVCRVTGYLREVGLEDLAVANAVDWSAAWAGKQVNVVAMVGVKDGWVRRVHSFDPPGPNEEGIFPGAHLQSNGIVVKGCKRVTVQDCHLAKPQHRGTGGNGYLFEVRSSGQVLFTGCSGTGGRHNFIQNWGFGTSGCVWHKVTSRDGKALFSDKSPLGVLGYSEYHHSLAMFNLVDASVIDDGWAAKNRGSMSTGAGHTATECTVWNASGAGVLMSYNFGHGYVIGTAPAMSVFSDLSDGGAKGTAPEDWLEGLGEGASLQPQSLFEAQLKRRLGR